MFFKYKQKEGAGLPAPQTGIAYYFYIIYNNFSQFMLLNILFIVCCIPVITVPAAVTAVNRVFLKLIRERNVLFFEEYWCEFKQSFKKSIPLCLFFAILMIDVCYMFIMGTFNNSSSGLILKSFAFFVLLVSVCLFEYCFALMAIQDLNNKTILKNAFLLTMVGWKTTIFILLVDIISLICFIFLLPVSVLLFAFVFFALKQYTLCWKMNKLFDIYIIKSKT